MLSITSPPEPDPLCEPAHTWQFWCASIMLSLVGAGLYLTQRKTDVFWFRMACFAEFAFLIFAFGRFVKKRTKRDGKLVLFAFMFVPPFTNTLHMIFVR